MTAVDRLSVNLEQGAVNILLGTSGCGKTTCLKLINRLIEPSSGRITINGENVKEISPEVLRRKIGYVIQSIGLFPHMTVGENIGIVPELLHWPKDRILSRVHELLEMVALDPCVNRDKYPRDLSGGEAQRVGVARALAGDPDVLLMDEPFAAVDPITRKHLQMHLLQLQKSLHKTIVFVTHSIDEAILLGDMILLMKEGHLVQMDTPEQLLAHPVNAFVEDFLGEDRLIKRLMCFPVAHILWPHIEGDFQNVFGSGDESAMNQSSDYTMGELVTDSDSVQMALMNMLKSGKKHLPVQGSGGEIIGSVYLEDLMNMNASG
ncbi:MAG: ABC transporter ATP-binding protein [Bacillota bacterium]|nr:ABC transporter ATP-binding protein [Bacillota bacterium]